MPFQGIIESRIFFLLTVNGEPKWIVSESRQQEATEWSNRQIGREIIPLQELLDLDN
jgi:hypothetical protein